MKTIAGVFQSRQDAERAATQIRESGVAEEKVSVLTPGSGAAQLQSVPVVTAEQPGMGKAIGAVLGASAGMTTGPLIAAAIIPGVGPITAIGLLGGAILAAAGGTVGAAVGNKAENSMTTGLPEDELFVYEDALRQGRSVVIAATDNDEAASLVRDLLDAEGAESVDAAREKWWIGLRSAEHEHYTSIGKNFTADEKFYRIGFEAALHARSRCKEYDQVLAEMGNLIDDLQKKYPRENVEEPFRRGYERGRDHYQALCDHSKAA
jgi:hypothetical protein